MNELRVFDMLEEEEEEMAALCIASICSSREWVHPINMERDKFGEFQNLMPQLIGDEERFKWYYRMTKNEFYHLLSLVGPKIEKRSTQLRESISAEIRLSVCLRYLATGSSYRTLGFSFRIGFSTIGEIVKECCEVIWKTLQPLYMPEPSEDEWKEIAKVYEEKWNYPHCIGALDGKHVQIRCPAGTGSLHYNYKGTYSIVLVALVDANYKFTLVDVGAYGKSSDGGTFERSAMGKRFENNKYALPKDQDLIPAMEKFPYVIVADEAFPLKTYMMRPYSRAAITSDEEKVYNYRHSRARRTVENAFGILAGRWRIFLKPIETRPETADIIVLAATCLHNMLRNTATNISPFEKQIRMENEHILGLSNLQHIRRNFVRQAASTRNKFKKYFVSEHGSASCPWQCHSIRSGRVDP